MNITKREVVMAVIIVILLLLGNIYFINKANQAKAAQIHYEQTISALNDSIHISIKNGIAEYSKKSPEVYLDQLTKTEAFKTLSKNQQNFYKQLESIKGLISATEAQLEKQGNDIASLVGSNPGTINNDSISYKLGTVLNFQQDDTSKMLKWNGKLTLDKKPLFSLAYDYKFKIQTTFDRQKDKSILVKYTINDPELKVQTMMNYTIPAEQKRTKFGRWVNKNKNTFIGIGAGIIFGMGGYAGYTLAK